jgi:hypothetical protein
MNMLRIQRTNIAPIMVLIFMLLMGAQAQADSPQQEITIQDDFSSSGDWNLTEGFAIQGGVLELTISEAGETYSLPLPDNTEYRNFAMAIDIASEQDGDYTYHLWFRAAGEG